VPSYTERLNAPIQSTAGDILYLTLRKLMEDRERGYRVATQSNFLLSAHDEIVLECPTEYATYVGRWLAKRMQSAMKEVLGEELASDGCVEVSYGPSWGESETLI
jgi:DNA polymerase I-like protein with 3'-5' exonuclease and polymerase domains